MGVASYPIPGLDLGSQPSQCGINGAGRWRKVESSIPLFTPSEGPLGRCELVSRKDRVGLGDGEGWQADVRIASKAAQAASTGWFDLSHHWRQS